MTNDILLTPDWSKQRKCIINQNLCHPQRDPGTNIDFSQFSVLELLQTGGSQELLLGSIMNYSQEN